jgi:hypothetical protein
MLPAESDADARWWRTTRAATRDLRATFSQPFDQTKKHVEMLTEGANTLELQDVIG